MGSETCTQEGQDDEVGACVCIRMTQGASILRPALVPHHQVLRRVSPDGLPGGDRCNADLGRGWTPRCSKYLRYGTPPDAADEDPDGYLASLPAQLPLRPSGDEEAIP